MRALANLLMLAAGRLLPRERAEWAEAMRSELQRIDDDFEALAWGFGCCLSSLRVLVGDHITKRTATASFWISFLFGAAIWGLSPLVTGHAEPWDADSLFYVAALAAAGFIVGWLCPQKIWPILPGLAMGQFAYILVFMPKGPLIAIGFVVLFIYGLVGIAAAFVSSRLRRFWPGSDDASRPTV